MAQFNKKELEGFRTRLLERQKETCAQLEQLSASAQPVSPDSSLGRLTRQDAMQQQQMALHNQRQMQNQLIQIKNALKRMNDGVFGECLSCEESISFKRLQHIPESPICLDCQRSRE